MIEVNSPTVKPNTQRRSKRLSLTHSADSSEASSQITTPFPTDGLEMIKLAALEIEGISKIFHSLQVAENYELLRDIQSGLLVRVNSLAGCIFHAAHDPAQEDWRKDLRDLLYGDLERV